MLGVLRKRCGLQAVRRHAPEQLAAGGTNWGLQDQQAGLAFANANAAVEGQREMLQDTVVAFDHSSTSKSDELVTMLVLSEDRKMGEIEKLRAWNAELERIASGKKPRSKPPSTSRSPPTTSSASAASASPRRGCPRRSRR